MFKDNPFRLEILIDLRVLTIHFSFLFNLTIVMISYSVVFHIYLSIDLPCTLILDVMSARCERFDVRS